MVLAMARPTRRPESRHYQARKRVPKELQVIIGKTEMKRSLPAATQADVRRLHAEVMAEFEREIAAARETLAGRFEAVPAREMMALCGAYYRREVAQEEAASVIDKRRWESEIESLAEQWERADEDDPEEWDFNPYPRDLADAEDVLREAGRSPDTASVRRMAAHLASTRLLVARTMLRRAKGDWGKDDAADKFPETIRAAPRMALGVAEQVALERNEIAPVAVSLSGLVREWARDKGIDPDAKPVAQEFYEKSRTAIRFASFIGHDDAAQFTKADVLKWKQDSQSKGRKSGTIRNDISDLSAVCKWAVRNGKLETNVFAGMLPSLKKDAAAGDQKTYTDEQLATILKAARGQKGAMRWLPWVLATTGARLDEVTQSNKVDIQVTPEGVPYLRIHADKDGTRQPGERPRQLKNPSSRRFVPLHPALIKEGFLDYVASLPDRSPLFPDISYGGNLGARSVSAQRLMRYFIRGLGITDKSIRPAHSFRHAWITAARKAQIRRDVQDAITGHARKENEADNYGTPLREMPGLLAQEMAKVVVASLSLSHSDRQD